MNVEKLYEAMIENIGFIADFEETSSTEEAIGKELIQSYEEQEDWYECFIEHVEEYAAENGLKKFVFCPDFNEKYNVDIFWAKDKQMIVAYISNNYVIDEDENFLNEHIIER